MPRCVNIRSLPSAHKTKDEIALNNISYDLKKDNSENNTIPIKIDNKNMNQNNEFANVMNHINTSTYEENHNIFSIIDKDKVTCRKVSQNKFLTAKKKYGKQVINEMRKVSDELKADA